MPVHIDPTTDVAIYTPQFERLDAGNADEFKSSVQSLSGEHARLVLDLSAVRFLDSSGLGALLSCLRQAKSLGGDLKLCALNRQVRELFQLVRMHRVFEIFASAEEAQRSYLDPAV